MDISGKVAVVTGASSGIGEATAIDLAKQGAKVVVVARRKDRLDDLVKTITGDGGTATAVEADVMDKQVCRNVIEQVVRDHGSVDILVNNAGVMLLGPVLDAPLEEWENMIHLNVLGLLYLTHAALPHMKDNGYGHIVNISSVAGRRASQGSGVYNASKFAVNAFTEALRQEVNAEKMNVRTTLIEPGAVETELISHNRDEIQKQAQERFKNVDKRLQSEDIARAITYAITQPEHVDVNEILIRPVGQTL